MFSTWLPRHFHKQVTMSATLVPLLALAAYSNLGYVSLYWYFFASSIFDGVSSCSSSLCQAYVSISPT